MDDCAEYAVRASRERMTPEELEELHHLGEKATRDAWEAFFRRVLDRVEGRRPAGPEDEPAL